MLTKELFAIAGLFCVLRSGAMADCEFLGSTHPVGPIFSENPCNQCFCPDSGNVLCAIIDCFYPTVTSHCPDGTLPVLEPGACCTTCPEVGTYAERVVKGANSMSQTTGTGMRCA